MRLQRHRIHQERPVGPAEFALEAYEHLPGVGSREVWRGGYPSLEGLQNVGNICYASSVCQMLLRVPAVALWLAWHTTICRDGGTASCGGRV